jgi:hypothetical protein
MALTGQAISVPVLGCGTTLSGHRTFATHIPPSTSTQVVAYELPSTSVVILAPVGYTCKGKAVPIKTLRAAGQVTLTGPSGSVISEQVVYAVIDNHVTIPFPFSCMWPAIKASSCYNWTHLPGIVYDRFGRAHVNFTAADSTHLAWGSFGMGENLGRNLTYQFVCVANVTLGGAQSAAAGDSCRYNRDILAAQLGN